MGAHHLAGNVRRLRQPGGLDLGGYRYSAFGETLEDTVVLQSVNPLIQADNRTQPLRWKGMWRFDLGGGVELYDARARMWSPKLGTFLSVDEFGFHDARSTLWGWPGQNSIRWRDPSGRIGMGDSASSDRAIGSSQSWGDSSFQTGLNNSAVFDAFALAQLTPLGYLLDAGLFVGSDKDLPLLGLMGAPSVGMGNVTGAAEEGGALTCPAKPEVTEGIYEFAGQSGKPYVGQSSNIPRRLGEHAASGKLPEGAEVTSNEVLGGKTAREIAEQRRINELGGIKNLENKVNPIGPNRQHLMQDE